MSLKRVEPEDHENVAKSEYVYESKNNVVEIWREKNIWFFDDEEITESDEAFLKRNDEALDQIVEDGFIRYPLFAARDNDGEQIEREAWLHPDFEPSCTEGFYEKHKMRTNIYVPSYKRAGKSKTIKMLEEFGVKNYYICIDPDQYEEYKKHYPLEHLLIRDVRFRFDEMLTKISSFDRPMNMAGHSPLCNFTVALSRSLGEDYFTFSDDDFHGIAMKAHKNNWIYDPSPKKDGKYEKDNFFRCSRMKEEYGFNFQEFWGNLERYIIAARNPGFVGLERFGTVFSLPISLKKGTRVYSLYLTQNSTQPDHIGYQNNDVITSMENSKNGLVNVLSEGICYNSEQTQTGDGGQSAMYHRFGTLDKGKILVRAHPNYSSIVDRYSRIHHSGNFNVYNKLRIVGAPLPHPDAHDGLPRDEDL